MRTPELKRMRGLVLAAVAGGLMALAGPSGARAGDEFEDGFKDELGRISAHEAFGVGRQVLSQILLGGGYYPYPAPHHTYGRSYDHRGYRPHGRHGYYGHGRGHYGRGHGHYKRHHRRHHHGHRRYRRPCDYGYDD